MNRLVVVSNRVPLPSSGPQAGGLAVALDGMMERRGGLWFGWSGKVSASAATEPLGREHARSVDYVTFDLTAEEHAGYYNRFANGVLWPLLHTLPELMDYDRRDAQVYRAVNERIADLLVPLVQSSDLIWIHDYHLLPLAAALRTRHIHNPVGFFLHIPFAGADVLGAAPEMATLVRDMLAADVIGFQTDNDLRNFAAAAQSFAGAVRMPGNALQIGSRRVKLGAFPVEIDSVAFARAAGEMSRAAASQRLDRSLHDQKLILGIDRLDPTKGLLQRVAGVRLLFEKYPEWRRRATALQISAASRKEVESYRALRAALDREAGALNSDIGEPDWTPLRLVNRGVSREVAAGYMRAADVGLVTPLRDGMNLVAKEFVAAQDPEDPGVLVLSRFAGAARQLDAALLVNPYDTDAMAESLNAALTMTLAERQSRWRALWSAIEQRTPLAWGRSFVAALVRAAAGAPFGERAAMAVPVGRPGSLGSGEPMAPGSLTTTERVPQERDVTLPSATIHMMARDPRRLN